MQSTTPGLAREDTPREPGAVVLKKPSLASRIVGGLWPLALIAFLMLVRFPVCPSRALFGLPCPGCGLTRATMAALGGDFAGMLHYHPLAPIMAPLFGLALLRTSLVSAGLVNRSWDPLARIPSWVYLILVVAMIALFVARLFGLLGGLPDHANFHEGVLGRAIDLIF
jgi:hypothetical protein